MVQSQSGRAYRTFFGVHQDIQPQSGRAKNATQPWLADLAGVRARFLDLACASLGVHRPFFGVIARAPRHSVAEWTGT